jgi:nucleotide-binding universal stress UspA family protein
MVERNAVIVCGVDGSASSERALEWAVDEAVVRDCTLRVVTAWTWDRVEDLGVATSESGAKGHAAEIQDEVVARVLEHAERAPEIDRRFPRGLASTALCEESTDADLLVLASHGHGTLYDKLVGTTAQRVLHHATCPVVVIPAPSHESRRPRSRRSAHREGAPAIPFR